MLPLYCQCGQRVFCDNTDCANCGRKLGFDPVTRQMHSLEPDGDSWVDQEGRNYQFCENRLRFKICNGLAGEDSNRLCRACALNRTIPILEKPDNILLWSRLERAKRRLVYDISRLDLPLRVDIDGKSTELHFDFKEDQRSHPDVFEEFVTTGYKDGLITINLREADDVTRVQQRELMGERFRTLLGHFRHEAGHFYFPIIVQDPDGFTQLFGDFATNYSETLEYYYQHGPGQDWEASYISAYASSHPLEDWAETFAHYLHIEDALETAASQGLAPDMSEQSLEDRLGLWIELVVSLNEVSRSLGIRDAYPFALTPAIVKKLCFVDDCVRGGQY